MAMVSLTIATLLKGQDDWMIGYYAIIPGVIIGAATFYYCWNYGTLGIPQSSSTEEKPESPLKIPIFDQEAHVAKEVKSFNDKTNTTFFNSGERRAVAAKAAAAQF